MNRASAGWRKALSRIAMAAAAVFAALLVGRVLPTTRTASNDGHQRLDIGLGDVFLDDVDLDAGMFGVQRTVSVSNPSNSERMVLKYLGASCGCVKTDLIDPTADVGEAARVTVTLNPVDARHTFLEQATFSTGLTRPDRVAMALKGAVWPRMRIQLKDTGDTRVVPMDSPLTVEGSVVAYSPRDPGNFSIESSLEGAKIELTNFRSQPVTANVHETAVDFVIHFPTPIVDAALLRSKFSNIRFSAALADRQAFRDLSIRRAQTIWMEPDSLYVKRGGATKTVAIRGSRELVCKEVVCAVPGLECSLQPVDDRCWRLAIEATESAALGAVPVQVATDHHDEPLELVVYVAR